MNVIKIPFEHQMFDLEFDGEVSNFIYDNFALMFTENNRTILALHVFYENDECGGINLQIHLAKLGNDWMKYDVYYDVEMDSNIPCGYNVFCNKNEHTYTNIGFDIASLVIRTICYIMNTPRDKVYKHKIKKQVDESKKQNKHKRKDDEIYLLDEIVEYVNKNGLTANSKATHHINCPCWSVRGHYRHYKSGKMVFIKNYKKGKNRADKEPESKTYVV